MFKPSCGLDTELIIWWTSSTDFTCSLEESILWTATQLASKCTLIQVKSTIIIWFTIISTRPQRITWKTTFHFCLEENTMNCIMIFHMSPNQGNHIQNGSWMSLASSPTKTAFSSWDHLVLLGILPTRWPVI